MIFKRMFFLLLIVGVLTLPARVVFGSASPDTPQAPDTPQLATSDLLNPEVQLSPDGNAERYQPAVAYNTAHHEFLVVWHNTWPGGERDIYARRVSASGQLLSWFCVTTGASERFQPAVAYNAADDQYLVVWMQEASSDVYEIWGRIIPWNAPGVNPDFRIISWANRSFWSPRVAWNSHANEYLVVWNALDTTSSLPGTPVDIAGLRVSASGVVQNPGSPLILTTYATPHQVDLVYNPVMDEYFLVFVVVFTQVTTGNDIYGLRVNSAGLPISPPGLIVVTQIANDQNAPAVALNSLNHYMIVWEHVYSSTDQDIYAREYDALGNPVGGSFPLASWTEDTTAPDVAASGSTGQWLSVWQETQPDGGSAIHAYYWGPNESAFLDIANFAFWENEAPAVAKGGPGYLVVYEGDSSITYRHIFGRVWSPHAISLPLVLR